MAQKRGPPPPPTGIQFPVVGKNKKGEDDRGSTKTQQAVFSAVADAVGDDPSAALAEKNWRFGYHKHLTAHVRSSLRSKENALAAANAGLKEMHERFEFIRDGKTTSFAEAMRIYKGSFETGFIKGKGAKPKPFSLEVPYKNGVLSGAKLEAQLKAWVDYGTIEKSAADAISMVANNPGWLDLSDSYFVMLGAGSAMGPYPLLMALGANVIAIDLNMERIWTRLFKIAEESCGTLTFPLAKKQEEYASTADMAKEAGSNLMTTTPEVLNWLKALYPGKAFTVGCYTYLDGERHVRVSLCCDAIMKGLTEERPKTSLAYLCTPTDCHVVPKEAHAAAEANHSLSNVRNLPLLPIRILSSKMLVKNAKKPVKADNGDEFYYVDGVVVAQGPNYALAKRLQHWRAIVARERGCTVASSVAPSTSTVSVTSNRSFAWAYDGMPYFKPFEIPTPETSHAVMTAILIHDLRNPNAVANANTKLRNPLELFANNAFHGGVFRCAYTVGSIGEVSVIVHFIKVLMPLILVLLALAVYYFNFM